MVIALKIIEPEWHKLIPSKRDMNAMIRAAFADAARYWWETYSMVRFTPEGKRKYHLRARSARVKRIREKSTFIKSPEGFRFPAQKPPNDLVWTGRLKHGVERLRTYVLAGKQEGNDRGMKATATSKKVTLVIKIPLSHPMRKIFAEEVASITQDEMRYLLQVAKESLQMRIGEYLGAGFHMSADVK